LGVLSSGDLVTGGWFSTAGGVFSPYIARYTSSPACYANCDCSSGTPALTTNDFVCFINKYSAGDLYANCDRSMGSPALTANDFVCFVNAYASGCS
jgi:hypothetical protein